MINVQTRGISSLVIGVALLIAALPGSVRADDPQPQPARGPSGASAPGDVVAKALAEAWPDRPEWLDMYTDILGGSQLGPNDGWFRRAVAQTRVGWGRHPKR